LIADIVMPPMYDRAMAESLAAKRPEMKILYVSRYGDTSAQTGVHYL